LKVKNKAKPDNIIVIKHQRDKQIKFAYLADF